MEYFQLDAADFEDGRICEVAFQTELSNGQPFGKLVVGGAGYHAGAQQAGGRGRTRRGGGEKHKQAGEHAAKASEATGALPTKERTNESASSKGEERRYSIKVLCIQAHVCIVNVSKSFMY